MNKFKNIYIIIFFYYEIFVEIVININMKDILHTYILFYLILPKKYFLNCINEYF